MNFEKAYRASVFAVAFWGLTALLITGQFNMVVVLLGFIFMTIGMLSPRTIIRNLHWNVMTVIAFVVALAIALRGSLLDASIYFFIFLQIVKVFTKRNTRDTLWIYAIAFFQVIGTSILTSSVGFAFIFLAYTLLMTVSLSLFTIKRQAEFAGKNLNQIRKSFASGLSQKRPINAAKQTPGAASLNYRLTRGFYYTALLTATLIMAVSLVFFAVIPRLSSQQLFDRMGKKMDPDKTSAFEEAIEFGSFEKIQLDPAVAMYVRSLDESPPHHLRLRGVAVDEFDGRRWRRTTAARKVSSIEFEVFSLRPYPQERLMVIQPPGITNFLFASSFPDTLSLDLKEEAYLDNLSNAAWLPDAYPREIHYSFSSRVEYLEDRVDPVLFQESEVQTPSDQPERRGRAHRNRDDVQGEVRHSISGKSPFWVSRAADSFVAEQVREARHSKVRLPDFYRERCLQIPDMLRNEKIKGLAEELTEQSETPFEQARAIEDHFRSNYGYSLEPKARGNYIEDFLFNRKEGHCEYFATSMVMLLRTLGIPSRVVNGFYSVEWNQLGNHFTVRQRDAHSWVEAYFEGYGWMTFDPTPPSGVGRPILQHRLLLAMGRLVDGLKVHWYRYVVDYSFSDQIAFVRSFIRLKERLASAEISFEPIKDKLLPSGRIRDAGLLFWAGILGLLLALFGVVAFLIMLTVRSRLHNRSHSISAIHYYQRILKLLRKKGFVRPESQTPREFAIQLSSAGFHLMPRITELYYANRFNGRHPDAHEMAMINAFAEQIRRS